MEVNVNPTPNVVTGHKICRLGKIKHGKKNGDDLRLRKNFHLKGHWEQLMKTTRRRFLVGTGCGLAGLGGLLASPLLRTASAATAPYTHDTSVLVAGMIAPEPFRSHWRACRGGSWPDYMRDQAVGHANQRLAGLLYTLEAIRYLKAGEINKGLLLASTRCHYVGDSSCIAHAAVWKPRAKDDSNQPTKNGRRVWSFLPANVQDYWLPFETDDSLSYSPLQIAPPPLFQDKWARLPERGFTGNMHHFFDQTHALLKFPGKFPETVAEFGKDLIDKGAIPDTKNWSAYDREFYGRWVAENIALSVLDRDSVLAKEIPIRFTEAAGFQAALEAEMANMVASISTYYRYLSVAANTEVIGDLEELFPAVDRIALLARAQPKIYLSADAPWPLKRACHLLAMEIVRGQHRNVGRHGGQYGEQIQTETQALFEVVQLPESEVDRRVVISWKIPADDVAKLANQKRTGNTIVVEQASGDGAQIILQGDDLQSTIHLIDYLLDLTNAPLNGRVPVEVVFTALRREWEGWNLIKELRTLSDSEAATKPDRPTNPHEHDGQEWGAKVRRMVNPNSDGQSDISGPLIVYSNLMLKHLPLPSSNIFAQPKK